MKLGLRLEISLPEAWEFSLLFIGWHVCTCFVLQSLSMVSLSPQMRDGFPLSSNVPSNRLMLLQELLFAWAIQRHEIQMGTES
jgi:hypothetical protein